MNLPFPQIILLQKYFLSGFVDFFDIIMAISRIGLILDSMFKPFPNNHFSLK